MFKTRFLQFAKQAYLLSLLMVVCWPESTDGAALAVPASRGHQRPPRQNATVVTYSQLFHRCSSHNVQVTGKRIFAGRRQYGGQYDVLIIQSLGSNSTILLQSNRSNAYVCFNKQGRLHTRYKFNHERCSFQETLDNTHYTQLSQGPWKIGFNKRGRPLKGNMHPKPHEQCYQFVKTVMDKTEAHPLRHKGKNHHQQKGRIPQKPLR